ncbi:MAG: zinc-binding alcohol dehydrogenase family protein [Candidatus Latescibacteria bacterium]|jgi:2-desacetyl-2-hydroxyethyl bacteriochlorophyllide A dehydrogenase|nr:zinc-binding alcohol dehydrogenase family protein [Candidatus Latescibacterota bacterium]
MKTILLEKPEHFTTLETDLPNEPGDGEALVSVQKIGICGTDLHAFRGRQPFFSYPRILGHELGVEVLSVGPNVDQVKRGDHCAVEPYLNCGTCIACRHGKFNCCEDLEVLGVHIDGGMREQIIVPAHKLHRSDTLALEQLALVETLGIGSHAVDRAQLASQENILVIGAGPIGLSVIQFAQVEGVNITLLEPNAQRVAFCQEHFNISNTITRLDNIEGDLRHALGGDLPMCVFDATGNVHSMHNAFSLVASGGRLTLVGIVLDDITFKDPEFHRREMTLLSSRNSLPQNFKKIIQLMESGEIDTQPWITHRATYDIFIDQFPKWLNPEEGVVKAMLEF